MRGWAGVCCVWCVVESWKGKGKCRCVEGMVWAGVSWVWGIGAVCLLVCAVYRVCEGVC